MTETVPNSQKRWADIHPDFKTTDADGKRLVMENGGAKGSILVPWHGPTGGAR